MAYRNQNRPPRSPSTKKVAAEEIASNKSPIIRIRAEKRGARLPLSAVVNNNSDVDGSTLEFTTKHVGVSPDEAIKHTHPAAKSANATSIKKPPLPKSVQRGSNIAPTKQRFPEKNGFVAMTRRLFEEPNDSAAEAEKEFSIHQTKKAPMPSLDIDHLAYKLYDNSLYEAENSPPDARDNVKLRMMEENHDSSMEKGISEENEENNLNENENGSPPISSQLRDLQSLCSTTTLCKQIPEARSISVDDQVSTEIAECVSLDQISTEQIPEARSISVDDQVFTEIAECVSLDQISTEVAEPRTPLRVQNKGGVDVEGEFFKTLFFILNSAGKEELQLLNGIGPKKAEYIYELRERSPSPAFKSRDDLKSIGISTKPLEGLMKQKKK